jgi:hypothetical protein
MEVTTFRRRKIEQIAGEIAVDFRTGNKQKRWKSTTRARRTTSRSRRPTVHAPSPSCCAGRPHAQTPHRRSCPRRHHRPCLEGERGKGDRGPPPPPNHHVVPEQAQAVGEPRRGVIPGSLLPQRRREKGRGWGGPSMEGWWRRKPTRMCSSAICSRGVGGEGGVGERRSGWRRQRSGHSDDSCLMRGANTKETFQLELRRQQIKHTMN